MPICTDASSLRTLVLVLYQGVLLHPCCCTVSKTDKRFRERETDFERETRNMLNLLSHFEEIRKYS